jgi:hypothetical protein
VAGFCFVRPVPLREHHHQHVLGIAFNANPAQRLFASLVGLRDHYLQVVVGAACQLDVELHGSKPVLV